MSQSGRVQRSPFWPGNEINTEEPRCPGQVHMAENCIGGKRGLGVTGLGLQQFAGC
jgi:hypothetical protein